jgi:hypothetical protein
MICYDILELVQYASQKTLPCQLPVILFNIQNICSNSLYLDAVSYVQPKNVPYRGDRGPV